MRPYLCILQHVDWLQASKPDALLINNEDFRTVVGCHGDRLSNQLDLMLQQRIKSLQPKSRIR